MFVSSFQFQILKYIVLGQFQQRGYFFSEKGTCSGERVESRNMSGQAFLYLQSLGGAAPSFPVLSSGREESRPSLEQALPSRPGSTSPSSTHTEA